MVMSATGAEVGSAGHGGGGGGDTSGAWVVSAFVGSVLDHHDGPSLLYASLPRVGVVVVVVVVLVVEIFPLKASDHPPAFDMGRGGGMTD